MIEIGIGFIAGVIVCGFVANRFPGLFGIAVAAVNTADTAINKKL